MTPTLRSGVLALLAVAALAPQGWSQDSEASQDSTQAVVAADSVEVLAPLDAEESEVTEAATGESELDDTSQFSESVDVTVVNVDVRVTDKDGKRILGLTRDDFRLFEDNRPVQVTNFFAVEAGLKQSNTDIVAADPTVEAQPGEKLDLPLNLVVYVDNFNIRPYNRNRVFRKLREFLQTQLRDDDIVMLVSYDRTLHVQSPFSTDRDLLFAKLLELERYTGHAVTADSDRRQVMRDIEEAQSESQATISVQTYAESTFSDLRFSIRALNDFVSQLAGVRGRRAILHVSDGIPMRAAESAFYALQQKYSASPVQLRAMDFDATREFRALAANASANGVTFYTIDAAGLRPYAGASVQTRTGGQAGLGGFVDSIYIMNHQQPLRFLADQTGGFAILNTNNVGPGLARVRQDFDNYYSLGYTPAGAVSGRGHRIKVEIPERKKLVIRHRESYREQTVAERVEDETLATLRFGLQDNPFGAKLAFEEMRLRDDGLFDVVVWLQIPVSKMTLIPTEDTHRGRLTVYVSALDEEGGVSDVADLDVPVELPSEEINRLLELDYPYRLEMRMRPGAHRVAVGIRDELGAKSSYLAQDLIVRSFP